MLALVTGVRLVLVRHAMPDVRPEVPAREWHLGDDGRGAARNLGQMLPVGARLVASDEPKAIETLAEASGRSDVVDGMAMTMWLFARIRPDGDRVGLWATLEFPDVVLVDLDGRNYQRSL